MDLIKTFKFGEVVNTNGVYQYLHIDSNIPVGNYSSAEEAVDALFAKEETITLELIQNVD